MEVKRHSCSFGEKPEKGKRPLGCPRQMLKDNIEM
jgi:hypothetical protein